ncbi:MAG TPA: hypothetical protein VF401_00555 [Candidatus Saccharimonadales bacterium]
MTKQQIQISAWGLSAIASVLAVLAWGREYGWELLPINNYQLFPLLGLLAFSLMWVHYVIGALRELTGVALSSVARFYQITGYAVLALICLHPGLLIWQRWRDGFGLPPHSYESYVAPGLGWITLLGSASLLVFLAYEAHRWFAEKRWWHFVQEAGDLAMLVILYHGYKLCIQFDDRWVAGLWTFYGVILVAILIRSYYRKYTAWAHGE